MRRTGVLLLISAVALGMSLAILADAARAQSAEEGETLFETTCVSCHTIGGGTLIGPDLQGVTERRGVDSTIDFIVNPTGAMPNLGVTPDQAADVVAFIEAQSGGAPPEEPPPAEPAPAEPAPAEPAPAEPAPAEPAPPAPGGGDPDAGKDLFTGAGRFEEGGTPCLSCHQIAGAGALGGGTLGPDLTGAYDRFGEGYVAFLGTGPMAPIFEGRPLTAQEEADLGAFLAQASLEDEPSTSLAATWFVLIGLGGAAVLLGLAMIVWRDRLGPVRRGLVSGTTKRRK